jgi:short-subunit dehydrogenase
VRILPSGYPIAGPRDDQEENVPTDKIALVTGGSSGIGLSVARKLARSGARVAVVARTERTLREAIESIGRDKAEAFPLDVRDLASLAALPARVVERFGALDIVVNNAGIHNRGPMLDVAPLDLGEMITANLTAPVVLTRAAAPLMRRGGSIVNVASLAGMVPVRFQATYGASKAGLRAFSRAVRDELSEHGINVSVVSPGPVDTGFFAGQADKVADITFSQPLSTPDEVADAVMECIREGTAEIALPWLSGKLCTLGYVSPALARALRPMMERRGARAKRAYFERKRT